MGINIKRYFTKYSTAGSYSLLLPLSTWSCFSLLAQVGPEISDLSDILFAGESLEVELQFDKVSHANLVGVVDDELVVVERVAIGVNDLGVHAFAEWNHGAVIPGYGGEDQIKYLITTASPLSYSLLYFSPIDRKFF